MLTEVGKINSDERAEMTVHADLHIHSRYSRATSKLCDLENLAFWAARKGIAVVGTGDCTHPAWRAEMREKLAPAAPGLFRLAEMDPIRDRLPAACRADVQFMITGEISTIYKAGDKTRKVHHTVFVPDLDAADRLAEKLAAIGNIVSDGRPILGLDSRHLLEIVLESDPGAYLIPAHIWTPWFSVLGSKSGFDAVDDCYRDLADHIFAVETGLSSDPPMNWRVPGLDRFRLVSNSDAHSPANLGREATLFDLEPDYFAIRTALETGEGYVGTVEFFPEEGKYHTDGHRKCALRLSPEETRAHGGRCPSCGGLITVGVSHRVDELAERGEGDFAPETAGAVKSLIPLAEILSEILGVGPKSKKVAAAYDRLLAALGPEFHVLEDAPLDDVARVSSSLMAEALERLRRGQVRREAGYDGEYGVIKVFEEGELERMGGLLFDLPDAAPKPTPAPAPPPPEIAEPGIQRPEGLDEDQLAASEPVDGPVLITAGPGSGKTRTLVERIRRAVSERGAKPESILAVTFTRRAAGELRERLARVMPKDGARVAVHTFHSLGLEILRGHHAAVGLEPDFRVAGEGERARMLAQRLEISEVRARSLLAKFSVFKRTDASPEEDDLARAMNAYLEMLIDEDVLDFDDLIGLAVDVLESDEAVRERWRARFRWISIDEYQDADAKQARLVGLLASPGANVCAIGDPDQAIYGFRGADAALFARFADERPGTRVVRLSRNYRSAAAIVEASAALIGRAPDRAMSPARAAPIILHEAATERAEAEFVAETIERMVGGHSFLSLDSGRADEAAENLGFSDFAVLYRADAQSDAVAEALARSGMPFLKRSHQPLGEAPGVAALMARLADADDLEAAMRADAEDADGALDRLRPIARRCGWDWARFADETALASDADAWDPRADRISLLTLHASKGLEFKVVFIVGCEDGIIPLRFGTEGGENEEEERRLFYVGASRAESQLVLSRARRRAWRGPLRDMAASPFLAAFPKLLVEKRRGPSRRPPVKQLDLFQ